MKRIRNFNISLVLVLLTLPIIGVCQKNVLILFPEDMGNHLGSLGTPGIETPILDNFAQAGVQFTANFCAQPVCSPSKGAIYTGRMPHDNGMTGNVHNLSIDDLPIPPDEDLSDFRLTSIKEEVPTLVEILNQQGYFTAITSKTHVQPMSKFRFDYGWGRIASEGIFNPESWDGLIQNVKEKAAGQGFFLMANTSLTHAPWQRKLVDNGISSNPEDRLAPPTSVDWKEIPIHPFLPDTEVARKDLARYFAMVELVDSWAGVLLKNLEESGLSDSTLVIFTPDHGMAYQRGKVACYPAGTQVPLIIAGPGVKENVKITAPVSHLDLMATILEFLEVEKPDIQHGRSLWPLLRGEAAEFSDRKTVMTETNSYYDGRAVSDGRWYYVRNFTQPKLKGSEGDPWANPPMNIDLWMPDHKVYDNQVFSETIRAKNEHTLAYELLAQIVEGRLPEEELYDLDNDPWAVNNLAEKDEYKKTLKKMQKELIGWQKKTNDPVLKK
ncbi:MAG: sulfatase [Cyclobacteriaceae bacterium]